MKSIKKMLALLANLFVPRNLGESLYPPKITYVVAIVPTFKPSYETFSLVKTILSINDHYRHLKTRVLVVDDCIPEEGEQASNITIIKALASASPRLQVIRTPSNRHKAGALNYGLAHLNQKKWAADVVITCDDDVRINRKTIPLMVDYLNSHHRLGAVCSLSRVINKKKNLLTRLQGLEYHNFNITKIADNGFIKGPLVMQGMLTAFRRNAIGQVKGYNRKNLIEDYEITAKLKKRGWLVGICQEAEAATAVPEDWSSLWRQRVRWNYWGLFVVKDFLKQTSCIIQDLFGHSIFVLISVLVLLSFLLPSAGNDPLVVKVLVLLAFFQFAVAYLFSIITLGRYQGADLIDCLLRLTVIPELIYATFLSLVVYGSYLFFVYNHLWKVIYQRLPKAKKIYQEGLKVFDLFGYSVTWGDSIRR